MEQIGPSTHEFAEARKLSRAVGDEMLTKLVKLTGTSKRTVQAMIIVLGLPLLDRLRVKADKAANNNTEISDILVEMVMLGCGWSAMVSHYKLTLDYIKMLDELNDMKVKEDNDLPPAKENP